MPPKCAKLIEHFKVEQSCLAGQPAPQHRQAMGQGMADRAAKKPLLAALLGTEIFNHDAVLGGPVHSAGIVQRMQHAKGHLAAQYRYPHRAQPLA